MLIAESRRRGGEGGALAGTDLPAELHHKLVWLVAAALRERHAAMAGDAIDTLDRALSEAAHRSLAAHDEGDRVEAAAMRLAAAIDAQPRELPEMLNEALGDRRVALFTALIAHALGLRHEIARELVFDPAGDRLWLALRAIDLPRTAIARIGYALSEADPRRDLESFADALDAIMGIAPDTARAALAPLRLDADYRSAMLALERGSGR